MKYNVLVFPAEGENTIEICNALSTCVNIKVYGASSVARCGHYFLEIFKYGRNVG